MTASTTVASLPCYQGKRIWEYFRNIGFEEGDTVENDLPASRGATSRDLLDRIACYLQTQKCEIMLEETGVIDEEYFREYLVFYATTHLEHPPTATRLHFFTTDRSKVEHLLDPTAGPISDKELKKIGYLGYLVLRPSCPPTVGECMLKIPDDLRGEKCFTHCATGFGQTLRGRRLRVETAPFISQDQTGMCAQAAIWGACKYLHKYRYYPKVSLPEITEMAGHEMSETLFTRPAEGLTANAMYSVLRQLGFQLYVADVRRLDNTREAVYTAIESGLPALLLLKQGNLDSAAPTHAVWAVGHTCRLTPDSDGPVADETPPEPNTRKHISTSQWVGHFLVHDDQVGPYLPADLNASSSSTTGTSNDDDACVIGENEPPTCQAQIESVDDRSVAQEKDTDDSFELQHYLTYLPHAHGQQRHKSDIMVVAQVVAPLPGEVFVRPPDARRVALDILLGKHLRNLTANYSSKYSNGKAESGLPDETMDFVAEMASNHERYAFRTYLCMSARYQEYAVALANMRPYLKVQYAQRLNLPEYVWVTEILDTELMTEAADGKGKPEEWEAVVGELIIDSTDPFALEPEQARGYRYLCLHVPGMFAWREGIGADDEQNRPRDEPDAYKSLLRADREAVYNVVPVSDDKPRRPFGDNANANDGPRSHRDLGPVRMTKF